MTKSSSSKKKNEPKCALDRNILNKNTVSDLLDIGLSIFAPLCGKNRGVFVLDPPDGKTYGCDNLPSNFVELAGVSIKNPNVTIIDSNAIISQFQGKNITKHDTVKLLDFFTKSVYHSTEDADQNPDACDAGGLAMLQCDGQSGTAAGRRKNILSDGMPLRAVTLAGVFTPAAWATGSKTLTLEEAMEFYTASDFADMKTLGLNTVQIPVPIDSSLLPSGAKSVATIIDEAVLGDLLKLVRGAELKAILTLVANKDEEKNADDYDAHKAAVTATATLASSNNAVLAVTLPSKDSEIIKAAREVAPTLALLIPANVDELRYLQAGADENIHAALDLEHATSIADIASSNSVNDRMKMFYHETIACTSRSPIEYTECYRDMPAFISNGFDLSIDDCIHLNEDAYGFQDYGQCGRFDETVDSGWWDRHRKSFAQRQLFAYERGLGWSFAAWKLYGTDDGQNLGVLDTPAKLLSLRDVAAAGLMPPLLSEANGANLTPAQLACLNAPVSDFILGDKTLAPTPGPPPDCGNGWWNYSLNDCEYWVPPALALAPAYHTSKNALATAAFSGGLLALVAGAVVLKLFGKINRGYTALPN